MTKELAVCVAVFLLGSVSIVNAGCTEYQYECADGPCIMQNWVCDGAPDCDDESDEVGCSAPENENCTVGQWRCNSGECIESHWRCDRGADCSDWSDEEGCSYTCNNDEFRCDSGSCIDVNYECDGEFDCFDGSDETYCSQKTKTKSECRGFLCGNKRCIHKGFVCDMQNDCGDNSDEQECELECTTAQHECGDGACIDALYFCDAIVDCWDMSDEQGCGSICDPLTELQCVDGTCIGITQSCDGVVHCKDGSDEFNCNKQNCSEAQYMCPDKTCILRTWLCDSVPDCGDGSDEKGCDPTPCREDEMRCNARQCVSIHVRCDGTKDCDNGLDEHQCGQCNSTTQYQCDNDKCIALSMVCNNQDDCGDGSDEIECFVRNCTDTEFLCRNGLCIEGAYVCDGDSDCFGYEDEDISLCTEECTRYRCGSGECIDEDWVCDGIDDCTDHSDEQGCTAKCAGFECADTEECLSAEKECDHVMDCGDGSDEIHCGVDECSLGISGCSHTCHDEVIGYTCSCPHGYLLGDNNRTCHDVDECSLVPEECEHFCVNNKGGFRCECAEGYILEDSRRCRHLGNSSQVAVFISTDSGIMRYDGRLTKLITDPADKITLFDVDMAQNVIVYYDSKTSQIKLADIGTNSTRVLYTDVLTRAMVIDPKGSTIYWSDVTDKVIMRGDYSGSAMVQLVATGEVLAYALAISVKQRAIYWAASEYGVMYTSLDTLMTTGVSVSKGYFISSIAVDEMLSRIYWTDVMDSKIYYVDKHNKHVTLDRNISHPLIVDVSEEFVFYLDSGTNEIVRYDRMSRDITTVLVPPDIITSFKVVTTQSVTEKGRGTTKTCGANELLCDDTCIDSVLICDGQKHCSSGLDEQDCNFESTCGENLFTCRNGNCIPGQWVCDANDDCDDGSDETFSACNDVPCDVELHFRCTNGVCISNMWRCDGQRDCADGSDENNCTAHECYNGDVLCDSSMCVTEEMRCDGIAECTDGGDEVGCISDFCERAVHAFRCDDKCIPDSWVCDGTVDCTDTSDERECFVCDPGQVWSKEERRCRPADPCQTANCQQLCDEGVCSCVGGYELAATGHCLLVDKTPTILLSLGAHIPSQIGNQETSEVFQNIDNVTSVPSVGYHYPFQRIIYVDATKRSVMSASMGPHHSPTRRSPTVQEIYHYGSTEISDIAVDWVSDNIYWLNQTYSGVMVSSVDGRKVGELLKVQTRPHGLVLDAVRGHLYWIGSEGTSSNIYTCRRDNTDIRVLFKEQFHPVQLTVDTTTGNVYWYDALYQGIFRTSGDGYKNIVRHGSGIRLLGYFDGLLYWSNHNNTVTMTTYDVINSTVTATMTLEDAPTNLLIFHPTIQNTQSYDLGLAKCRNNKGGCEDLCFGFSNTVTCGCIRDGQVAHCTPAAGHCTPSYCLPGNSCYLDNGRETCTCTVGSYGAVCEWSECEDPCDNRTSCYYNSLLFKKMCCKHDATECTDTAAVHSQAVDHGTSYTTLVTALVSATVAVLVISFAFLWLMRWRRRRQGRKETLVAMYTMEPVIDDLIHEDDAPLLYD